VLFGPQVKQAGGLLMALARGEDMGAEVLQLFAQSPRQWRRPSDLDDRVAAYRQAVQASASVRLTVCHAPYLINLGSPDHEIYARSTSCLIENLSAAARMGAAGLILHAGSHRGAGLESCLDRVAAGLRAALDEVWSDGGQCPILLENTAGGGGTIGRSFDELAQVIEHAGSDERLGVCLDSQHLWAAGVDFGTTRAADTVVRRLERIVGLDRLACLHLNDSKVGFGTGRDRHENIGRGQIGPDGLRALLGQPRLQHLPVVLEVPGLGGDGAGRADLALTRQLHAEGRARRGRGGDGRASAQRYAAPWT
jgi:deoxyribonuclease-4